MPQNPESLSLPPSLWAVTAEPAPACPPLDGPLSADVAIVGGGFTGLSAALHLAEAGKQAVVLEAGEPGWGASGRNGGQVNPGWKILPSEMAARYGPERGGRITRMADGTCDLVFSLIDRFAIACDAVRPGYVQGGFGRRGYRMLDSWTREWSALGAEVALLDGPALAELIGTERYDAGMLDARGGNLQPLSYARGLAQAAIGLGARICGDTRATTIERQGAGWRVGTARGTVDAGQVLLGSNGYTDRLWPGLRQTVVPVPSFIIASEPLGQNTRQSVLPGGHAVSETRRLQVYYRFDRDGRFLIGGRGNTFDVQQSGPVAHLRAEAHRLFPQLPDLRWDFSWGGYVAITPRQAPKLMRLAPGVFAGLGYNGRGVAMATMMGRQLALAAQGEDPDMAIEEPSPIPLHAVRQAGISWTLLTGRWLDGLDRLRRAEARDGGRKA